MDDIQLYMAPLEGITGYIFRNAHNEFFGEDVDKYFAPFIMPHEKRDFSQKELNELSPDHNKAIRLVPQILTIDAKDCLRMIKDLRNLGYEEINLNFGCPSGTVASKGRGAAALADTRKLDDFLKEVFESGDDNISVKTRIGVEDPDEFNRIMEVYIKYPIKELIVHPRVLKEQYTGFSHKSVFINAVENYDMKFCYNGDISTVNDYRELVSSLAAGGSRGILTGVMIGRGILHDPALIREIAGGSEASDNEIRGMLLKIRSGYERAFSGQTPVLHKMKEIWSYLKTRYPEAEKAYKKLMKSKTLAEYDTYERMILAEKQTL